jgi:hypothetical protein
MRAAGTENECLAAGSAAAAVERLEAAGRGLHRPRAKEWYAGCCMLPCGTLGLVVSNYGRGGSRCSVDAGQVRGAVAAARRRRWVGAAAARRRGVGLLLLAGRRGARQLCVQVAIIAACAPACAADAALLLLALALERELQRGDSGAVLLLQAAALRGDCGRGAGH